MSQTSVIFFGLLVGFVVFITIRGELSGYLGVIGLEGGGTYRPLPTLAEVNDAIISLGGTPVSRVPQRTGTPR